MKIFPAWKLQHKSRWCKMALALQKIESIFLFQGQKQSFLYKILLPSACSIIISVKLFLSQHLISYPSNWSNLNIVKRKELFWILGRSPIASFLQWTAVWVCTVISPAWALAEYERRQPRNFTSTRISIFSPEVSPFLGAFISQIVHLKEKKDPFSFQLWGFVWSKFLLVTKIRKIGLSMLVLLHLYW